MGKRTIVLSSVVQITKHIIVMILYPSPALVGRDLLMSSCILSELFAQVLWVALMVMTFMDSWLTFSTSMFVNDC